jgi:hypothetical protein
MINEEIATIFQNIGIPTLRARAGGRIRKTKCWERSRRREWAEGDAHVAWETIT